MVSSQPGANVLTVVLPNLLCWIEHQDGRGNRKQDPPAPLGVQNSADGRNENLKTRLSLWPPRLSQQGREVKVVNWGHHTKMGNVAFSCRHRPND